MYNYGTFSFNEPGFYIKFVRRELDYRLSITTLEHFLAGYFHDDRPVIEQRLNLTPSQKQRIFEFVERNYLPENRYYRYDFFFDNCSTRLRDVLESVLGAGLAFPDSITGPTSFRRILDPYVRTMPFIDVGFDIGLGLPTERTATARETMFLPEFLMAGFDGATLAVDSGAISLVAEERRLFWYKNEPESPPSFNWLVPFFWGLSILVITITALQYRRRKRSRNTRHIADALLFGAIGLFGCLIVFLWFFSEHSVAHQNLNLAWMWPTHVFLGLVLVLKVRHKALAFYLLAYAAVATLTCIALPILPQNFHAVSIAIILMAAARSAWLGYSLLRTDAGAQPHNKR